MQDLLEMRLSEARPGDRYVLHPLHNDGDQYLVCDSRGAARVDIPDGARLVVHLASGQAHFESCLTGVFVTNNSRLT